MKPAIKVMILSLAFTAAIAPPATIALAPGGSLAATEIGHVAAMFFRLDRFRIKAASGLSHDLVDVYWSGWIDGSGETRVRIIHNGKPDQPFPIEYGENDFSVFYAGECILENQRQFKFARWHYHDYTVHLLNAPSGKVSSFLSSIGPDKM